MFLLAVHPAWQCRLRKETDRVRERGRGETGGEGCDVEGVFEGRSCAAVQWEQVQRLSDMACVLNESLRLFPPIPAIGRTCVKVSEMEDSDWG